ncbi:MAG: GtrA family protein [Deltaproteobacteria bacterium]|nr:MAG: GtrA family protein [Deltaproteobacteria bacterium]
MPRALIRQLVWYLFIGGLTTGMYYVLWAVLFTLGVDYRIAAAVGYGIGSLVNYGLQKVITFRDKSRGVAMGGQFLVYWIIVALSLGLTVLGVWIGVAGLGLSEWLSVVLTSAVNLGFNFGAHRGITFNARLWDPRPPSPSPERTPLR